MTKRTSVWFAYHGPWRQSGSRAWIPGARLGGAADTLTCGFWSRWGRLSDCKVTLATGAEPIPVDTACKRLGVVNSRRNGLALLVCDSDQVHALDPASNTYLPLEE